MITSIKKEHLYQMGNKNELIKRTW